MTVLSITINDPVFDKKSAEISYLLKVLEILKTELGRGNGTVTSGTILGQSPSGVANTRKLDLQFQRKQALERILPMTKAKVEGTGMTSPRSPAPSGPHISQPVRETLKDQDPEIARHVRQVADTK